MDSQILEIEKEIIELKGKLQIKENELRNLKLNHENKKTKISYSNHFEKHEIEKYCRQIILNEVGIEGQKKIKLAKVLIVGAGGLGCPAAQYLVAAGIGTLGLVDSDVVSISNLHRQILYDEADLNLPKVDVAFKKLTSMNNNLNCIRLYEKLTRINCVEVFQNFDVILDCTDNVPTRYLVNDVCVLLNKPLIAGNAIKFEGQLFVYIPGKTSCYRCLFPSPPSRECVGSCNEDGVLGAIPGVIGTLQSLEVLKLIIDNTIESKLTIFDGSNCRFRHLNLRSPKSDCAVCSEKSTIKLSSLPVYEEWCGMDNLETIANYPPKVILLNEQRITVQELVEWNKMNKSYLILDVRPNTEFEMCRLPNSVNIPLRELCSKSKRDECFENLEKIHKDKIDINATLPILVLCRCGNDSQKAVQILKENNPYKNLTFFDLAGGLYSWNEHIDKTFPLY